MSSWPTVRLGEVLRQRKEFITIDDIVTYRRPCVKLHAQGIALRDEVPGALIKTKKQQVCRSGEFLVAEIDAKVGGFGIVPESLNGSLVSSHYFLFTVDEAELDRRFLDYFIRTPTFRDQVEAQGSTNYAAIRPGDVLGYKMPLPPLPEQHRIVGRIGELAAEITVAQRLRAEIQEEAESLIIGLAHRGDLSDKEKELAGWRRLAMCDVVRHVNDSHRVDGARSYPNLGIYSYGRGLFRKPDIEGASTSAQCLRRVHRGQFIYSRLFAFEGAYGVVTDEFDNRFVSNEYPTFDCDPNAVLPEFLGAYFKAPSVWRLVAVGSKGIGLRRQRVQPEQLLHHQLWVPPLGQQRNLAAMASETHALSSCLDDTRATLDAFMPAILDRAFKGEL